MAKSKIVIPRELLLIEIERRCRIPDCDAKICIGLTKDEARSYTGFECVRCKEWNADLLSERDVPEWWEEIAVMDLHGLRSPQEESENESGDVISRMSDNYHLTKSIG